jgi:hypothetical protein
MLWRSNVGGTVTSIWIYVANTNMNGLAGTALIYTGAGYADPPGSVLAQEAFTFQGTMGWQEVVLTTPLTITGSTSYMAAVFFSNGHYASTTSYFTSEITAGALTALSGGTTPYDVGNGRYAYGGSATFPQQRSTNQSNYWIDVTFDDGGGGGGGNVTVILGTDNDNPDTNTSVNLTATPSGGTNYTYAWTVIRGSGTFGSATAAQTTYTPTVPGKHIVKCVVTATEGSTSDVINLTASDPTTTSNPSFTATVDDPLAAQANRTTGFSVDRGGTPTMQRRSLYGHRLSFGDPVTNTIPVIDPVTDNPATYTVRVYMQRNCWLTGLRFLKAPLATGDHVIAVWQLGNQTPLLTKTVTLATSANPEWFEVTFDEPLALTASDTVPYLIGYHATTGNVMTALWTYGSQPITEYPFYIGRNGGGFGENEGSGRAYGTSLTYPTAWVGHSYFIDPYVEWESEDVVYEGGLEYLKRFDTYKNINYFPIGIWQIQASSVPQAAALGINTVVTLFNDSSGDQTAVKNAIVTAGMDVYMQPAVGDVTFLPQLMNETAFYDRVKGFLIRDEPDLIAPFDPPSTLQTFYAQLRKYDATKLIIFNFGWPIVKNKGFAYQPNTATLKEVNQYWREYARITDIISCDFYMEDSRNLEGSFGLWCNPRMVQRLQDVSDKTRPVWHYIATAATPTNQPTPTLVNRSIWASLIGGARGIVLFDYTFTASNQYVTDFSMGTNTAMANMIQALCTLVQSLKDPLLAAEANLPVTVSSSNVSAGPVGGEWGVPIHYTIRQHSGTTYLFTQSIRPGTTTATFTVPAAANKTITVIGESRTLNANGSGVFTDSFGSDYEVHLYQWT